MLLIVMPLKETVVIVSWWMIFIGSFANLSQISLASGCFRQSRAWASRPPSPPAAWWESSNASGGSTAALSSSTPSQTWVLGRIERPAGALQALPTEGRYPLRPSSCAAPMLPPLDTGEGGIRHSRIDHDVSKWLKIIDVQVKIIK